MTNTKGFKYNQTGLMGVSVRGLYLITRHFIHRRLMRWPGLGDLKFSKKKPVPGRNINVLVKTS